MIDEAVGMPSMPTAPPANLLPPGKSTEPGKSAASGQPAPAALPPGLAIEVVPSDASIAAGKAVAPGVTRTLRIALTNRGTVPLARIAVTAQLDGARADPSGPWRVDGALVRAEVRSLAPGARMLLPLQVRSADPGPAGQATGRVLVDARVQGQPPAGGDFAWTVRDCPGAYHAALEGLRTGALAELRRVSEAMRKGNPDLPAGGLRFRPAKPARGAAGAPIRIAASIASRRGGDPELARNPLLYTAARTILELDQYMKQRAVPTLCTGAAGVVAAYRRAFAPVERRLAAIRGAAARARSAPADLGDVTAVVAAGGGTGGTGARSEASPGPSSLDDLAARARRAAIDAGLLAPEAPAAGSALATLAVAARAGTQLDPAAADALSAIEVEAWLAEAEAGADRLSRAFNATLDGILAAHAANCTCGP
ncbi:hypothetical protein [Blastochloris sulfoviridis]|uniref:DUF11 domain-containing protein n=1 Tax=Blastochloris sulfoviridis TaxID=50712 RepID=A0A5M6I2W3_9HYPH|nr:hypothetical protein [Blastochloris sulfoviridis]KAA5602512.1 hypothetical protein F1193_04925 [Blastochloris sulfoviridis]